MRSSGGLSRAESLNPVFCKRSFLHGIFRRYQLPHYSLITKTFHGVGQSGTIEGLITIY
ncbi:hypothetical protein ED5_1742 [Enterobacter roggenkampii]|nr:hypothetical protein ED5_1742 [Enterobacter roggenkampii]